MANRNLFKLEMLILKTLESGDYYGYQLVQDICERSGGQIEIVEGTLYPIMYKLEDAGYVTGTKKLVKKRQERVYYHLEKAGKKHLESLISDYRALTCGIEAILKDNPPNDS